MISTIVFQFNLIAKRTLKDLPSLCASRIFHRLNSDTKSQTIVDEDEGYEDPSPEEILDWIYADEDSRPEEDQYSN